MEMTERERTEEMSRRSENQYRRLIESSHEVIFSKDLKGRYHSLNLNAAIGLGRESIDEIVGRTDFDLLPKERAAALRAVDTEVMTSGESIETEELVPNASGELRRYLSRKWPTFDDDGKVSGIGCFAIDITQRTVAQAALAESESKYRILFESSRDAIMTLAPPEWLFTSCNPATLKLFGLRDSSDFTALGPWHLSPERQPDGRGSREKSREMIDVALRNGSHFFEWTHARTDGATFASEVLLTRFVQMDRAMLQATVRDITARKLLDDERHSLHMQLQQAQKLESIGTLAGGIAHDFNNILTSIMGYSEMVLWCLPEGGKERQRMDEVLQACLRARDLVKQILAFARQNEKERMPILMRPIVKEALKLLRASIPSTISFRENICSAQGMVRADPTEIHQVLMNLCTNAYHAMQGEDGTLEVTLTEETDVPDSLRLGPEADGRSFIRLAVRDTGQGIDEGIRSRIFDPYFTTKEVGVGTGLGLAVVHRVVQDLGGYIEVDSEKGKGTAFQIYLPKVKGEEEPKKGSSLLPSGNGEHILLVDDEITIAEMGNEMLEALGYKVTVRTSSIEALEAFRANSEAFDLVVTDMTMPNLTGLSLSRELLRIKPGIPIILCTGYSEALNGTRAGEIGVRSILMKPILMDELAAAVRQSLCG